ncbi:MAG: restriction endonuclease subunit S [Prevotella sp.]|nr:restriction endonuclease subunit S [Prevotella sp.]
MEEWREYKLGDILNFRRGHDLPHSEMKGGVIPVAGSNGVIGYHDVATPISPCITIGRSGNVGTPYFYEKCWAHNTVLYVDDFKGNYPLYLYYLLKTLPLASFGGGSAVPTLNRNHIHPLIVRHISNIEIQKKVASVLKSLDDKIEVNRRLNENLEQQAQALFKSWFVDFEPFKNGEFVESELGMIPKGWRVIELQNVVTIKRGGSPRPIQAFLSESGYKWLKISDATACMSPFLFDIKESIKKSGLSKTVLLKPGNLVLSNSATPGIPKILGVESCIHDGWLYFPQSELSNYYLYLLFLHKRDFLLSQGNGSVFTNLKTEILKAMKIALPIKKILLDFDKIIVSLFFQIENNTKESRRLAQLRDTLLPRLMSGELKVNEIENVL